MDNEKSGKIKLCPFCESGLAIIDDGSNGGRPYLECPTCGLRFHTEGFEENPRELKSDELN